MFSFSSICSLFPSFLDVCFLEVFHVVLMKLFNIVRRRTFFFYSLWSWEIYDQPESFFLPPPWCEYLCFVFSRKTLKQQLFSLPIVTDTFIRFSFTMKKEENCVNFNRSRRVIFLRRKRRKSRFILCFVVLTSKAFCYRSTTLFHFTSIPTFIDLSNCIDQLSFVICLIIIFQCHRLELPSLDEHRSESSSFISVNSSANNIEL